MVEARSVNVKDTTTTTAMEGIATPSRVDYTAISTFRLRSRVRIWQVTYQNGDVPLLRIRISISINNGAGAPAKSLRIVALYVGAKFHDEATRMVHTGWIRG